MRWIFIVLLLLTSNVLVGQTHITGRVIDQNGQPLFGANVLLKGTYDGASSSMDGAFDFTTAEVQHHVLIVTSVGYKDHASDVLLNGGLLQLTIELEEAINQLEAVEISAGSFVAGDESRRTILKALDIVTTAGATADIAGVLNTLPGTQKVGESGRLFVRGGDGSETRTFIDGVVVLDAYSPAAPNTPSRGRFLPFMFKGTSFSTGGYGAEYGQALSSVLALDSKDKAETTQTDIGILSVGGDVAHTQVWDRSSWSGKVQYTDIRPYYQLMTQVVDWKTPPVSIEGSSAFRQQVGQTGLLKLYGNFSNTSYSLYNHDINEPALTQLLHMDNVYQYGNAAYQQALNGKWNIRGGLSYSFNRNAISLDGQPMDQSEKGIHSKLVFENSVSDKIETKVGVELITRRYYESTIDSVTNDKSIQAFNEMIAASFAETQIYVSNKLVAKAGIRVEYDNLNQTAGVDPRLSLAYKPGSSGQFSFAYGRFRQSPKNIYLIGNQNLGSEKAEHFILNYQVVSNQRTFRIETYYKRYFNLIKFGEQDVVSDNSGYGYARGVELFWRDNKSLRDVDYWVSYSYLDTKRDYLDFPSQAIPAFASRHNFSVVYKHFVSAIKTQLGLTYSYASPRPYYNPNNPEFNSDRTPSYQDLSANLSFLPKKWLIIHASCTNLLGRNNIFGYQYAGAPNAEGMYARSALAQPARHFLFLAVFITISKNKSVNQLPNL